MNYFIATLSPYSYIIIALYFSTYLIIFEPSNEINIVVRIIQYLTLDIVLALYIINGLRRYYSYNNIYTRNKG